MKLRCTRAFILIVAVLAVTIGTLIRSCTVRHEARSTYAYRRGG